MDTKPKADTDLQFDEHDREVAQRMLEEMDKLDIARNREFDSKLVSYVGRLHDERVKIGKLIIAVRKLVFEGTYKEQKVVIKIPHAKWTFDHDEKRQQQEKSVWMRAKQRNETEYFAEIFLSDRDNNFLVQRFCENVRRIDYNDLSTDLQAIANNYNITEIQVGEYDGKTKFVDYGY